ncbi:MAG: response regulator [Gammaproteobacteria bacterium]|nr:response regulator [Gammaproteobacteria bacterium]
MIAASTGTITSIIVDDETHARQALRNALAPYSQISIIAECEHGLEAIRRVNELHPQVLFLDIHMPKLDGFDVLELLGDDAPLIVFVTAYDEYAIRAFDKNALDYLLKPLDPKRLQKTIERVEQRLLSSEPFVPNKILHDRQQTQIPLQRILVRDGSDVHIIPVDQIYYIEAADDYIAIQLKDKTHIKQERLQNLEMQLDQRDFCRIHRSYILNLHYLLSIESESKDSKVAILKNESRLPISRNGYNRLKELL